MPNSIASHQAKLRLAARTLIEWKVPVSTEQYQTVLKDLLEAHPFAQSWGLKINSKLFDLDQQGIILWYLSETLTEGDVQIEQEDESSFSRIGSAGALTELCFKRLIRYGTGADADRPVWVSGPAKSSVVERVLEIFEDPLESGRAATVFLSGYHVLVSMLLDDSDAVKQDILREFWRLSEQKPLRSTRIRNLALVIKNSSVFLSVVSILFGLISIVKILRDVTQRVYEVFGNAKPSRGPSTIFFFLIASVAFVAVGRQVYRKLRIVYADVIAALRSRISSSYFDMFLSRPFQRLVGFICTTNMPLFQRLLTIKDGSVSGAWDICMRRTSGITSESARNLLPLMARRDLDELTKSSLFRWLCSVNIRSKQSIYRSFARQAKHAIDHYKKRLSQRRQRINKRKRKKSKRI